MTQEQFFEARKNMIVGQIMPNNVIDEKLLEVFRTVKRHHFVPEEYAHVAYCDAHIPVAPNRFILSPVVLARMLLAADIKEIDTVLDIACTRGYSSALISSLAKKVIALESEKALVSKANFSLTKMGLDNCIILSGKLSEGHSDGGPYDVIFINGAIRKTPETLLEQLKDKGRLVAVEGVNTHSGEIVVYVRNGDIFSRSCVCNAAVHFLPDFI